MKKYVTTLYQSMVDGHIVRIGMVYYSSTRTHSPRLYVSWYLRVGATVVQIVHCREVRQLAMLRHILIVLSIYQIFLSDTKKLSLDPTTPKGYRLINSFVNRQTFQSFKRLPLRVLMDSVFRLMVSMSQSSLHGRMNVQYSPESLTLFLRIHTAVLTYFMVRSQHPTGSYVTDIYQ